METFLLIETYIINVRKMSLAGHTLSAVSSTTIAIWRIRQMLDEASSPQ